MTNRTLNRIKLSLAYAVCVLAIDAAAPQSTAQTDRDGTHLRPNEFPTGSIPVPAQPQPGYYPPLQYVPINDCCGGVAFDRAGSFNGLTPGTYIPGASGGTAPATPGSVGGFWAWFRRVVLKMN